MTATRRIIGAIARCWLSASAIALALVAAFDGAAVVSGTQTLGILGLTSLLTAGYGATLWLGRRHLRDDAKVGSRRDVIAGFLAIVLLVAVSVLTQGMGIGAIIRFALCLLAGAGAAMLMYFPWREAANRAPYGDETDCKIAPYGPGTRPAPKRLRPCSLLPPPSCCLVVCFSPCCASASLPVIRKPKLPGI